MGMGVERTTGRIEIIVASPPRSFIMGKLSGMGIESS